IIGVGAGVTAGALVVHPEVERIVVCEIEPVVPQSAQSWFAEENHHVFDDPRVELVYDDARHYLQTTRETFDIITSDPVHPWVRGAATLYSLEYLQLVSSHLNPGGAVTQWVPLYETDAASVTSEIGTFAQVFPDTTLWSPDLLEEGYDLVVLGRARVEPISEAAVTERLRQSPAVQQSLAQVSLGTAASLLAKLCRAEPGPGSVAAGRADQPRAAAAPARSRRVGRLFRPAVRDLPVDSAVPPVPGRPLRDVGRDRSGAARLVLASARALTWTSGSYQLNR
ncbi:MAG: fused MFS/spermidine synthase, partial [Acidobacteriota bacterium]|nr:fused MFS/spermidine synthase [Acidobacteriota bacterium]